MRINNESFRMVEASSNKLRVMLDSSNYSVEQLTEARDLLTAVIDCLPKATVVVEAKDLSAEEVERWDEWAMGPARADGRRDRLPGEIRPGDLA